MAIAWPTIALLDHDWVGIDRVVELGVLLAQTQYILQAIQRHLHYFAVHHCQEVAQRGNAALFYQESETSQTHGFEFYTALSFPEPETTTQVWVLYSPAALRTWNHHKHRFKLYTDLLH